MTFVLAGLGGALGALFATHAHSVRTMVWTAGAVGAVSAVGMARWAYRWTRRSLPEVDRMEPVVPVDEHRFPGVVWGPVRGRRCRSGGSGRARRTRRCAPGPAIGTGTFGVQPFPGRCGWSGCGHRTGTTRCACGSTAPGVSRTGWLRGRSWSSPSARPWAGRCRGARADRRGQGRHALRARCAVCGRVVPPDRDDQDDQDSPGVQGSSRDGSTAST
ncbi:hypothetical protein ACR6C2_30450 [Streptomyces sp. INA 01156]